MTNQAAESWRTRRVKEGVRGFVSVSAAFGPAGPIHLGNPGSKSYFSRILRLALLAPDISEAILGGWADQRMMLEQLERPLPMG